MPPSETLLDRGEITAGKSCTEKAGIEASRVEAMSDRIAVALPDGRWLALDRESFAAALAAGAELMTSVCALVCRIGLCAPGVSMLTRPQQRR